MLQVGFLLSKMIAQFEMESMVLRDRAAMPMALSMELQEATMSAHPVSYSVRLRLKYLSAEKTDSAILLRPESPI